MQKAVRLRSRMHHQERHAQGLRQQTVAATGQEAASKLTPCNQRSWRRKAWPSAVTALAVLVMVNLTTFSRAFSLTPSALTHTSSVRHEAQLMRSVEGTKSAMNCIRGCSSNDGDGSSRFLAVSLWSAGNPSAAEPAALRDRAASSKPAFGEPSRPSQTSTSASMAAQSWAFGGCTTRQATTMPSSSIATMSRSSSSSASWSASASTVDAAPTSNADTHDSNISRRVDDADLLSGRGIASPNIVRLVRGDPIEFWHAKGLVLGNYEGPVPGRQSLAVRTEAGLPLTIDAGQIVGLWSTGSNGEDMRGSLPTDPTSWAELRAEARALLQDMPARGLDLEPFWRAAGSKGKGFVATPAHAAEYLFGAEGQSKRTGLKKRRPFEFNGPGEVFTPNAVERAAAAQVLAGEISRFKRVVSKRLDKPPTADADEDGEGPLIQLGGFKAVDQSVAVTREVAEFCRVVKEIKGEAEAAKGAGAGVSAGAEGGVHEGGTVTKARGGLFEPAFLLILHSLEAFAIGGDERSVTTEAKRVMELMGKVSPVAAKSILVDVGLWTRKESTGTRNGGDDVPDQNPTSISAAEEEADGEIVGGEAGVIPWPAEALESASALARERVRRGTNYDKREPQKDVGAPAPFGRHDFRGASFGVYCIDGVGSAFLDDAFSIDPKTREVFIHIIDVQGMVPQGSTLDDVARLRAASEYLPQGPLFMMPPTALKAMSFSDKIANEAITVGIRLDPKTGSVASSRVMLTTLPPAIPLTFDQADRILEASENGEEGEGKAARIAAEIRALEYIGRRSAEAGGRRKRGKEGVQFRLGKEGQVQATEVHKSRAKSLVNELLTVYTLEMCGICKRAGVAMPSLVGQQGRVAAGKSRYGTGPLRRYVDILAQRQIAAVLRGSGYLPKKYLMETASYLTWRQNKTRAQRQMENDRLSFEALAAHCQTQMKATGLTHAVVPARGTGLGREVRLDGLGVRVHVKRAPGSGGRGTAIDEGEEVKVVIERVDPRLKQVVATEFSAEEAIGEGDGERSSQ